MRFLCAMLIFFINETANAHPHVWIDIEITPIINVNGEITALHQRWIFDPLYSEMMLEVVKKLTATEREKRRAQIQQETLDYLAHDKFYTHPQEFFGVAKNPKLTDKNDELALEIDIPLKKPTKNLYYQIYDPTYYTEVLHSPKQKRSFGRCQLSVRDPEPNPEKEEEAAALDMGATAEYGLGQFFAEIAEFKCQ